MSKNSSDKKIDEASILEEKDDTETEKELKTKLLNEIDEEDKKVVKLAWNLYKDTPAKELAMSTHRSGTPWSFTYSPYENNVIPNSLIKKYYDKFVNNLENYLKSA